MLSNMPTVVVATLIHDSLDILSATGQGHPLVIRWRYTLLPKP